jgi:hypothetical protein
VPIYAPWRFTASTALQKQGTLDLIGAISSSPCYQLDEIGFEQHLLCVGVIVQVFTAIL